MDLRPKGPIFGLTLRGMLLITALLAVGMAFVGTKVKRARDEDAIAREIVRLGGSVQRQYYGMDASSSGMERTWFERLIDLDLEAHVTSVELHGDTITDVLVARLAGLEEMQSVGLSDTGIDATALAALAKTIEHSPAAYRDQRRRSRRNRQASQHCNARYRQRSPRGIGGEVVYPPLSDAGLAAISGMPSLHQLRLCGLQFTNATLRELKQLPRVQVLSLSNTRVSDDGIAALAQATPALSTLSISQCPISGTGLEALRHCPRLLSLQVGDCPLTDEGMASMAQLPHLRSLWISISGKTILTDEALRHIGELTTLTDLMVFGANFTDDGLPHLTGLESLATLNLQSSGGTFTDAALEQLAGMKQLTSVSLNRNAFSAETVKRLQEAVPGVIVSQ